MRRTTRHESSLSFSRRDRTDGTAAPAVGTAFPVRCARPERMAVIDDDRPLGGIMSRREALAALGAGAMALWASSRTDAATPTPGCVATPAQTDGPFFVEERLNRSDIRADPADGRVSEGVPLILTLAVQAISARACAPLPGAIVDVWHCDARGVYSGVAGGGTASEGRSFLRGYQVADGDGRVRFVTIYPGKYPGRAVHIHFKVRGERGGRRYALSSQLYFDDALNDLVLAREPYTARGPRRARNADDFLYRNGGDELTLAPVASATGYDARFDVGLKLG
jgi:protocatechuate 3,4-dioxygenase beta subunit